MDPKTCAEKSNFRLKLHQYFKILGTLIQLEDIAKIDRVKRHQTLQKIQIPQMEDLLPLTAKAINHNEYDWLTAQIFLYGCRLGEGLSLFLNKRGRFHA